MKNKIINLFNKSQIIQNKGIKYSVLLEQFMTPFADELADLEYYENIIELAISAWNFGNLKLLLPEDVADEAFNGAIDINMELLKRMIDYKVSHFREYTNFIADYNLREKNGDQVLSVLTHDQETFLTNLHESMEKNKQDDYDENYINRTAIIIKPLHPFLDWCSNLYPDDLEEMKETKTYLISEDIKDVEAWLKKKFDKIFMIELETWHSNKKEWPQKRNYKMFNEWFQIVISTLVFDFVKKPIIKS